MDNKEDTSWMVPPWDDEPKKSLRESADEYWEELDRFYGRDRERDRREYKK